jgi:small-conductance mechanosensitive channel
VAKGGDIQWSGRVLRAVLWRAPLRVTKYTVAGYMATSQEVGRRWIAMTGLGLWLWFLWRVALGLGVQGFIEFTSFLLLLWIWRFVVLVKWTIGLRVAAARARAQQRQMLEALNQLPGQIQQAVASRAQGGSYAMPNLMRHHDPEYETQRQAAREQADRSRSWLPVEQQDMPLGDRHDPVFPMPKWMRKHKPKGGDDQ